MRADHGDTSSNDNNTNTRYNAIVVTWSYYCAFVTALLMSDPFAPRASGGPGRQLSQLDHLLLLAARGRLSGDGQLQELMRERRRHDSLAGHGDSLWYLSAELCQQQFGLAEMEAVVVRETSTAIWLQLRFGGELRPIALEADWLHQHAQELPPGAELPRVALGSAR